MKEDIIVAGLLHDMLEDTYMTEKELQEKFGSRVLELVKGASEKLENRDNTSWEDRKQHTIDYIKTADRDIQYIACADKLSNVKSMLIDYEEIGDKLWERFNRGYEKQKWYYENMVDSLQVLESMEMYEEFKIVVNKLFCG